MVVFTAEDLHKSYGPKILFNKISFTITDDEKIGLIGINGTGKTSLLNLVSGVDTPDSGTLSIPKGIKVEYLSQNPDFNDDLTVLEYVFMGDSPILKLIREYEHILDIVNHNPKDQISQDKLIKLSQEMDKHHAWNLESQIKIILTKLGITDFDKKIGILSGGQKKRTALARVLIAPCDLLILDEPTNHMDNETIDWLETYLQSRSGALLMVTHDRYFLDRVANRIIELDLGELHSYSGNYQVFVEKKSERQALASTIEKKRQSLYKKELEWMRTSPQARSTKQKARIQRFEEIEDAANYIDDSKLEMTVAHTRLGKKIIDIDKASKSFGDLKVLDNFSYTFTKNDRIGIIGDNGIGKSSFLNLIHGNLTLDEGSIDIGSTVKMGYFSQESEDMDESLRVIDYIKDTAQYITNSKGEEITAALMLERFLFTKEMQWTYIRKLSGGEKRRLYLLKVLMESPNVIFLDEPTNDLDIDTLKVLESYIDDFQGVVVTVSHDRYFLDRVCQRIFAFSKGGKIVEHTGNYTDYLTYKKMYLDSQEQENTKTKPKVQDKPSNNNEKLKFSFNEKREFESIEKEIQTLEETLNTIDSKIESNPTDFVLLQNLAVEKDQLEEVLLEKMERFEYLSHLNDSINNNKNT